MEQWLQGVGLANRIAAFHEHGITSDQFGALTEADLRELGLTIGERKRFRQAVQAGLPEPAAPACAELKQVTVLFADLVRSTELVAQLDPEDAMRRLLPAIETMCAAVARFQGTVVRTLGDGIMALFGAPRAQEGHALLACQAALAIRDAFPAGERTLAIRVGLHSGEVVADAPVSDPTRERGAHGLTIHLGSRLSAMVEPGDICISSDTFRLVRSFCDVVTIGRHRLRGVPDAVELFRLTALKPAVASQQFRGAALTSFRGRAHEMRLLARTLHDIASGTPRVTAVVGAPGTGKSRLCYEFAEWCRRRLIPVFEARAQPYGAVTPLQPVLELLRSSYFRISRGDAPSASVAAIAALLGELGEGFAGDVPLVCEFLGVPIAASPPSWLSPKARNTRLLDIVRALVRHRGTATSVIIIEDLHWLDEASEAFVAAFAEAVLCTRTMLVVNCRPAWSAAWMETPHYQQIELAELNPADTDLLVDELIGRHGELAELRSRIAARSAGNPFFAEELVRSLAESGVLSGERGDYRQAAAMRPRDLPGTVQAVIGARIDRLAAGARDLLQIGAIIGKEFPLAVLQSVARRSPREVAAGVATLCQAGLLHPSRVADGSGFAFRHPLIQEVAYATQLRDRRSRVHEAVARALERFYRSRIDEFAALLCHHFEEAGDKLSAARYAARAARWVGSTSPAQAIKHWHQVRALMQDQPPTGENLALKIDASSQIAWLGWPQGLTAAQARPFIQEALDWAREIDHSMIPLLLFLEARVAGATEGHADAYVERVRYALSLLKPDETPGRAATLHASLCQAYGWAGLLREALDANDRALAGVAMIDPFDHRFLGFSVEHWCVSLRGRILIRLGRFDEGRACLDRMLQLDEEMIDPTVLFISSLGYIELAWAEGAAALAEAHAGRIAAMAARHGSPYLRAYAYGGEGTAYALARDYDRARRAFGQGLRFLRDANVTPNFEPELLASLAECQLRAGARAEAEATARLAIEVAQRRSLRLPHCRALIVLALALRFGAAATAALDGARDLLEVTGAAIYRSLLAEAQAGLRASNVNSGIPYPHRISTLARNARRQKRTHGSGEVT